MGARVQSHQTTHGGTGSQAVDGSGSAEVGLAPNWFGANIDAVGGLGVSLVALCSGSATGLQGYRWPNAGQILL